MDTPRRGFSRSYKTPKRGSDRALIRELFLERVAQYDSRDVLRLTRSTEADLTAAIAAGDVEPLEGAEGLRFAWDEVAALALRRWTPRVIARALGRERALPPLNATQTITIRLPRYQVQLLAVLVAEQDAGYRHAFTVSDVLEAHLLDLASSRGLRAMERAIPGFTAAVHFPYVHRTRRIRGRRRRT